ncbi:MAG: ferritin-like domain-containing protein [Deltaproteobacteria bacterium]|nr:ferritin-like domain-containing protein [Deltaproteobacteria bacterium]
MAKLRLDVGPGPLRAEHDRLLRTALRRGDTDPEGALAEGSLEGTYSERALQLARNTWRQRMVHEHHSAAVFARLLPQLMAAAATLEHKTTVLRMAMDELRHASLCAGVVTLLGGEAEVETDLTTQPLPEHADGDPVEACLRNVMFVGCLSETVSIALLTEERELTREPVIERVVAQLAADEVLHAKLGWSYLAATWPELSDDAKERTERYLPIAFGYLREKMHGAMPLGAKVEGELKEELEALGVMASEEGRELFAATVEAVIVPRLEDHGLPAREAWATTLA